MGSQKTMIILNQLIESLINFHNRLSRSSTVVHNPSSMDAVNQFLQSTTVNLNNAAAELDRSSQISNAPVYQIPSQCTGLQTSTVSVNPSHQCTPVQKMHSQDTNTSRRNCSDKKQYHVPRIIRKETTFKKESPKADGKNYIVLEKRGPDVKYPVDPKVLSKQIQAIEALFEPVEPGSLKRFKTVTNIVEMLKTYNLLDRGLPRGSITAILRKVSEVGNQISSTDILTKLFPLSDGISCTKRKHVHLL